MRSIRLSRTYTEQLTDYLDAGEQRFGRAVADAKRAKVVETLRLLAHNPRIKRRHPDLGLVVYPVGDTPFFLVYDYDDAELRVLYIFINGKPLSDIDPAAVDWS